MSLHFNYFSVTPLVYTYIYKKNETGCQNHQFWNSCFNNVMKYRWKGENVATTEVADHLIMMDCIEEANVYGVKVPGMIFIQ